MKLVYLGCPYSSPHVDVRAERVRHASYVAARLMLYHGDFAVYSPITHGHELVEHLPSEFANNDQFWMRQCLTVLRGCDMLMILPLAGWLKSKGLAEEIALARAAHIPIHIYQGPEAFIEAQSGEFLTENNFQPYWD